MEGVNTDHKHHKVVRQFFSSWGHCFIFLLPLYKNAVSTVQILIHSFKLWSPAYQNLTGEADEIDVG